MKRYTRVIALILAFVLGVGLCGCAKKDPLAINAHKWQFSAVQNSQNGELLYASPAEQEYYGGDYARATPLELTCKVTKKELILQNKADGQSWRFGWELQSKTDAESIYKLTGGELPAAATVTATGYSDGSELYTLLLSFAERTVYFYAEK